MELFLDHIREREAGGGRRAHASPGAPPPPPLEPLLHPQRAAGLLLPPARREALRALFTHWCCQAGGPRAGDGCGLGLAQWLVGLREAGLLRAKGLRAGAAAFAAAAARRGPGGGGAAADDGEGDELGFGGFLFALELAAPACGSGGGGADADDAGADADAWERVVDALVAQLPELLLVEGGPLAPAFTEVVCAPAGGGGGRGGGGGAATCDVARFTARDDALLALYSAPCLQHLAAAPAEGLLWRVFLRFAEGGAASERALTHRGVAAALRALGAVAPACAGRGGRGLTVMEGLQCAFAARPPRLQRGAPKAPDALCFHEFVEWAARCALAAFAWAPACERGAAAGGEAPAPGPVYSADAKRAWALEGFEGVGGGGGGGAMRPRPRHLAAFSSGWVGRPPARAGSESWPARGAVAGGGVPFETATSTAAPFGPVGHTRGQLARLARAEQEVRVAEAEAAAQRMLRHAAARLAALDGRAAATARRQALQARAAQMVPCGGGGEARPASTLPLAHGPD